MKEYKIATWSKVNNEGENSFLSKTHLTLDGETAICGRKIPLKRGQEQFTVVGKPGEFVDGPLFLHTGERVEPEYIMIHDLKDAKCCSVCEKKSQGIFSFAVYSVIALADAKKEAREVARQARIAARKEVA